MENLKISGKIKVAKFTNGVLVSESDWIQNVITTVGKNSLASLLNSASAGTTFATHIGFGSSTTAVAVGDTVLGTELSTGGYARQSVTRSNPSANVIRYVASLTNISTPVTVQEVGLFTAVTGGTLVAHQLTGAYPLNTTADSLQITWDITIS